MYFLLILLFLLIGITVSRFSKSIPANITKTKKQLIISLCVYIGLILLDFLFGMSPIYQYILDDIINLHSKLNIIPIIAHIERYHKLKGFKKLLVFLLDQL